MDIYIDDKTKEYIRSQSQDSSVHVSMMKVGGGWCATYQPSVKVGRPYDEKNFKLYKVDDINVYLASGIIVRNDELKISLSKIFWIKSLNVDGISL